MGETTALASQKPLPFSEQLMSKLNESKEGLVPSFNVVRFTQNCVALLNSDEKLQNYPTPVLINTMMKAALLDLDPFMGDAYAIPYGKTVKLTVSYLGAMKLIQRFSIRPVKEIGSEVVRDGDQFEVTVNGENTDFTFKPLPFNDGKILGAFAYVRFADGGCQVERMTLRELENVRKQSKAPNSAPWAVWTDQMYRKSAILRLSKKIRLDLSAGQRQIWKEDVESGTDIQEKPKVDNPFGDEGNIVEGDAVEVVSSGT